MKTSVTEIICALVGAVACILVPVFGFILVHEFDITRLSDPLYCVALVICWGFVAGIVLIAYQLNDPDDK